MAKRSYTQRRRAEAQEETRRKIVEAAVSLHQARGFVATTIGDIAERAGVGRVTVYRHFPDETALLAACSGHYFGLHPLPDPEAWRAVEGPAARLRKGLSEAYAYHRETEAMMMSVLDETRDLPIVAPYFDHWRRAADVLAEAWPEEARGPRLRAGLRLAVTFETWRFLVRQEGLSDEDAITLMARMTGADQGAA